jgi:hypothetical protein
MGRPCFRSRPSAGRDAVHPKPLKRIAIGQNLSIQQGFQDFSCGESHRVVLHVGVESYSHPTVNEGTVKLSEVPEISLSLKRKGAGLHRLLQPAPAKPFKWAYAGRALAATYLKLFLLWCTSVPNGGDRSRHLLGSTVQKQNLSPTFCNLLGRRRYPKRALDTLDHRAGITCDFAATEKIKGFLTTKTRTCAGGSTYVVPSGYQGHLHAAEISILIEDWTARVTGTGTVLAQRNILGKSQHVINRVIRVVGKSIGDITNP